MILLRWCIPDINPKLRDRIRREAYVTNEIIIQQEAVRACERSADEIEANRQFTTLNETANRWNRVMRNNLSSSDFDLEIHGSPVSPPSTHTRVGPAAL